MPWKNDREARERSNATYGGEWRKARARALERAGHRCERCGSRRRLQVDHIINVASGGTHSPGNLQVLCSGPGSCHAAKTAAEGNDGKRRGATDPACQLRTQW